MKVVVTDRRFGDEEPYRRPVEEAGGELVYADCRTEADVVEACRDATVVVSFKAPITEAVIDEMDRARLIVRNGTGYDNVDVTAATKRGIPVSNIPDYCTQEVASHAITLALAAAHEVVHADRDLRSADDWGQRRPVRSIYDGTFGVIGFGRIGRAASRMAAGLGMTPIAYDPYQPDDVFDAVGVERVAFETLLERSDVISVHASLTGETHHMLSAPEFASMKDDAIVVNTARGPIVDESSLVDAVEEDDIWGAGLDVFEVEPPRDSPTFATDRIVVSPHHGGESERSRRRCIEIGVEKITAALRGEDLGEVVNPEAYGKADDLSPERTYWSSDEAVDFHT